MPMIVVCYEESPVSERVLERAAQYAKLLDADILVTSVAPVLHGRGGPIDPADSPERHAQELHHAVARLEDLGAGTVESEVLIGDPGPATVRLAARHGASLIVVGAHEGGLVSRLLEGSVTDAVVHAATTDVLVVH